MEKNGVGGAGRVKQGVPKGEAQNEAGTRLQHDLEACPYKSLLAPLTELPQDTPFQACGSLPGTSRIVRLQMCSWWSWQESKDTRQGHGSKVVTINNELERTVTFLGVLQTGG